jgi:hypothetical protein
MLGLDIIVLKAKKLYFYMPVIGKDLDQESGSSVIVWQYTGSTPPCLATPT